MTCMLRFAACYIGGSVYSCNIVGPAVVVTLGVQHSTCEIPLLWQHVLIQIYVAQS